MKELSTVRVVVETHYHIGIKYLDRIMKAVAQADPKFWPELSDRIAEKLTPHVAGQLLMEASSMAGLITKWIKELDPTFTGKRKKAAGREDYFEFRHSEGRTSIHANIDGVLGQRFHKALKKLKAPSMVDALMAFLQEKAPTAIVQNLFTPLTGGVSWIPGVGYLSQQDSREMAELATVTVDLDSVATRVEKGYTPSPRLRMYVMARDATCRFPGCSVTAENCQLDHVIPWGEKGGVTAAWNLQCLCAHHHNMKTDNRVEAAIDSMGRVKWVGPCNQPAVTEPMGPLAQEMPTGKWGQTLQARMEAGFKRLRESLLTQGE